MPEKQLIYHVALPVPLRRLFDYLPPLEETIPLSRGMRVKVPFGRRQVTGLVMHQSYHSGMKEDQLKRIIAPCDPYPLFPLELCDFLEKTARYYHHPIGEVIFSGTPMALRQGKPCKEISHETQPVARLSALTLNAEQETALKAIL